MNGTNNCRTLLVVALAIAGIALTAGTVQAQGAKTKMTRDAAMQKCFAEAQAASPDVPGSGAQTARTAAYKACMTKAGFRP